MNIPQIQIQTTDIQMDYNIRAPQIRIEQQQAQLSIEQPAAIVEIHTTDSEIQTDMTQFYNDLGYKKTGQLISEFAQQGKSAVMSNIAERAKQGRQLLENSGKDQGNATIVSLIKQKHGPKSPPISNIRFIPSFNSIKINFTPSSIDINIQPQEVKIDVQVNKPKIDLIRGDVTGTMVQRPSVHIDVIG